MAHPIDSATMVAARGDLAALHQENDPIERTGREVGMWRAIRYRLEYTAFRAFVAIVDALPPAWIGHCSTGLAFIFHQILPSKLTRSDVARENLQRALGDSLTPEKLEATIYRMWRHFFLLVGEMIQSPRRMHLHTYQEIIRFPDMTTTNDAVLSGRQILFLGGHYGNWEVGLYTFGIWGFPMGVVAREMDNPYLHLWFQRYRESCGHRMMLKKGDFVEMQELMKRGGNMALLCDQDAGPRGQFVDFFGHPASTFKSIALLAHEYDAIMMVTHTRRIEAAAAGEFWPKFTVDCTAILDPRNYTSAKALSEITCDFTRAVEQAVRKAPEQYFWLHRRWKSEPKSRAKAA